MANASRMDGIQGGLLEGKGDLDQAGISFYGSSNVPQGIMRSLEMPILTKSLKP